MSTASSSKGCRVVLEVPAPAVAAFAAAVESHCEAVSWFGEDKGPWQIEGYAATPPDRGALAVAVALAAAASKIAVPEIRIEPLPSTDWARGNLDDFPAITIGRFWIHGSHDLKAPPSRQIPICVDAATAFGTGRHASTAGCLAALSLLAHRPVTRFLDMGCGSGILAIAAAKLWRIPVVAVDNDPEAVIVTRQNARRNRVGRLVTALCADSYAAPGIITRAPYDLIASNILARPLRRMARDLARCLTPGGVVVLAGFLETDANAVLAAHRLQGLRLARRITIDGWQTLMVVRQRNTWTRRCDV